MFAEKNLTNRWPSVKFVKVFHRQTFMLYRDTNNHQMCFKSAYFMNLYTEHTKIKVVYMATPDCAIFAFGIESMVYTLGAHLF